MMWELVGRHRTLYRLIILCFVYSSPKVGRLERGSVSHPIMCDNGLGNMYNLRENMAN
jgi:hypothetical protein